VAKPRTAVGSDVAHAREDVRVYVRVSPVAVSLLHAHRLLVDGSCALEDPCDETAGLIVK